MEQEPIRAAVSGCVLAVTLSRPETRNALDEGAFVALEAALARAAADPAVRAVVLASTGHHFSAGADVGKLRDLIEAPRERSLEQARRAVSATRALALMDKPTVAVVQGGAHGAGAGLVLACDVAIAEEKAHFAFGETRIGLYPGLVAPLLAAAVGRRAAARLLLTGARIEAAEALRIGLVHELVPLGGGAEAIRRFEETIRGCAPAALAATKRLLRDSRYAGPPDTWDVAWMAGEVARHRAGEEAGEGVRAFLAKRPPAWAASGGS